MRIPTRRLAVDDVNYKTMDIFFKCPWFSCRGICEHLCLTDDVSNAIYIFCLVIFTMQDQQAQPLVLDRKIAATMLGISRATLDREVASKRLLHIRVGTRVLFTREHLERYLEVRTQKASKRHGLSEPLNVDRWR